MTNEKTIEEILKPITRKFRLDPSKVATEIAIILMLARTPLVPEAKKYRLHHVSVSGKKILAADAHSICSAEGIGGRGKYRHLIDPTTLSYLAVAMERDSGQYRIL